MAATFTVTLDGAMLRRGFWLYVWEIATPNGEKVLYVGRTGDSSSPNAQSLFNRMGQNLGTLATSSMVRNNLEKRGFDPVECTFRMVGRGPVFEEPATKTMEGRFAPTLRDHPDPRMNLRGFGGAQSAIALYTLSRATTPERARSVIALNALADGFDAGVSALEWKARGELDRMAGGGLALNLVSLAFWTWAAAALRARPEPEIS